CSSQIHSTTRDGFLLTLCQLLEHPAWREPLFLCCFIFSCCSAVLLNYSLIQCTNHTSALTTSIIGVMKNILITYAGMFVGGDYRYSTLNFIGVTISALGAVLYVLLMYKHSQSERSSSRVVVATLLLDPNVLTNKR
ncbi:Solute carrier family 35 (UDP-glucuronic acid/UDP-N-acetylgalactosamine dual transporter) member D1b, partial [Fasciolopsis buskii]